MTMDDGIERGLQVIGSVDVLHDTAQGVEHAGFSFHRGILKGLSIILAIANEFTVAHR
jgi:hypothetical protein